MISVLITGPTEEPVSIEELRSDLRLNEAHDDQLLASLLTSARLTIEAQTGVRMMQQSWRVLLDTWSGARLSLPHWPLVAVTELRLLGDGGAVVPPELYETELDARPPLVLLKRGASWPLPVRPALGIQITLTAGFGASASDVPLDLRQAVRSLAAHWFEDSEWHQTGRAQAVPARVQTLLQQYRAVRL